MSTSTSNNANLIQRIGKRDFKYIVMSHVDGLQEDVELRKFFGKDNFDTNDLASHQDEFLTIAFTSQASNCSKQYIEGIRRRRVDHGHRQGRPTDRINARRVTIREGVGSQTWHGSLFEQRSPARSDQAGRLGGPAWTNGNGFC